MSWNRIFKKLVRKIKTNKQTKNELCNGNKKLENEKLKFLMEKEETMAKFYNSVFVKFLSYTLKETDMLRKATQNKTKRKPPKSRVLGSLWCWGTRDQSSVSTRERSPNEHLKLLVVIPTMIHPRRGNESEVEVI